MNASSEPQRPRTLEPQNPHALSRSSRRSSRCSRSSPRRSPDGEDFLYEPKWDGFRAIVFRGGGDVYIQSRDLQAARSLLSRAARRARSRRCPSGCVVDGEIVIATPHGLDFDALQHAAASRRVAGREAGERDAGLVRRVRRAGGRRPGPARPCRRPSAARRLERLLAGVEPPIHLTPMTRDRTAGGRMAGALRGRRPRRRDRQARGRRPTSPASAR